MRPTAGDSGGSRAIEERLHLGDRLALRPKEAAEALGIGERTLRQLLPELPHFRVGGVVLLPVEGLQAWLRERAKAEGGRSDAIAGEILQAINASGGD